MGLVLQKITNRLGFAGFHRDMVSRGLFTESELDLPQSPTKVIPITVLGKVYELNTTVFNSDLFSKERSLELHLKYAHKEAAVPTFSFMKNGKRIFLAEGGASWETVPTRFASYLFTELALNPDSLEVRPTNAASLESVKDSRPVAILFGTGATAEENPYFVGEALGTIRKLIENHVGKVGTSILTLYGAGPEQTTQAVVGTRWNSKPIVGEGTPLNADLPADLRSLVEVVARARQKNVSKLLLAWIGHGSPLKIPLWGGLGVPPSMMKNLMRVAKAETVIVGGSCFSGAFARSAKCGFFAARPELKGYGCYHESVRPEDRRDYTSLFFTALGDERADFNHDGSVSFREAHWYAYRSVGAKDVPYSDLDALTDRLSSSPKYADRFTRTLEGKEIEKVSSTLSDEEQQVFSELLPRSDLSLKLKLSEGQPQQISFSDLDIFAYVQLPQAVQVGWTYLGDMPTPRFARVTKSVQLLRRAVARQLLKSGEDLSDLRKEWQDVEACESQSIRDFLKN